MSDEAIERRRRALAIFDAIAELDHDARAQELDRLCAGDADLRRQVQALLDADAATTEPFDGASAWTAALRDDADPGRDPMLGRTIGAWKLVEVIGRGGMGAVYAVERGDGAYAQQAALKLIRASADSAAARERFLRERQILARLRHPHIATLLDGGFSSEGEPYFVMERIDGVPIDRWCDAHRLGLRERIVLFLQVLDAVGYAHRNLVVHRDLKPSNLLVDADGRVKLLDFGIAKQLQGGDATATHDRALTFEYASPEQLHDAPITTATDLWQLGVILHRLLTGTHPFGLTRDTPVASQLQQLEREPEPLTRAAAQATPEQAAQRGGLTPTALAQALRGSLAAIVQACLRRDPEQRQASADALASDLRAWLDDRPIATLPLSRGQRARLWLRRNRALAASIAAVSLALLAGTGVALWQANAAREQARIAQRESESARASLQFLTDTLAAAAPEQAMSTEVSVRQLLDKARGQLDHSTLQPRVRQTVQRMLGHLYVTLGDAEIPIGLFAAGLEGVEPASKAEALALADDWKGYAEALGGLEKNEESLAAAEKAESLRKRFAPDDPQQQFLALSLIVWGHYMKYGPEACARRLRQAIALADRHPQITTDAVLDAYSSLAGIYLVSGDNRAKLDAAAQGLGYMDRHRYPADSPRRITFLRHQGGALVNLGQAAKGVPLLARAVEIQRKTGGGTTPATILLNEQGMAYKNLGDYRKAADLFARAIAAGSEVGPSSRAIAVGNLALMHAWMGDYPKSMALYAQVDAILREGKVPADEAVRRVTERNHAIALIQMGRLAEAASILERLRERAHALDGAESNEYLQVNLALLALARRAGDAARGASLLREVHALLPKSNSPSPEQQVAVLRADAAFKRMQGEPEAAERALRDALELARIGENRMTTAFVEAELAAIRDARGDKAGASALLGRALPVLRAAVLPNERNRADAEALARKLGMR